MTQNYKYFAFISYNSKDEKWGKRLHKKLEGYRMPATLCSKHGWKRKPANPIFFAPYDIQPGGLTEELKERLRNSKNLIVICSPHSAQSQWVGMEIEYFHQLGRTDHIHFFIIDGIPHSGDKETECFNPVIDKLGIPEILGANIHEKVFKWGWLNKERAYVQLITKLLGVEFDSIWQRHRRMLWQKIMCWIIGGIAVLSAIAFTWIMNLPFDANISLKERAPLNKNLPPLENATVTLFLDKEQKTATIKDKTERAIFQHIPHSYLGKKVRITIQAKDFVSLDTTLVMEKGISLSIARNEMVYGNVKFYVFDDHKEMMVPHCPMTINGTTVLSDENGQVKLHIPLKSQDTQYVVTSPVPLKDSIISMPSGESDVVRIR